MLVRFARGSAVTALFVKFGGSGPGTTLADKTPEATEIRFPSTDLFCGGSHEESAFVSLNFEEVVGCGVGDGEGEGVGSKFAERWLPATRVDLIPSNAFADAGTLS